jgi:hypothetical protein
MMLEGLRLRTGLPIKRAEIGRINFPNDAAEVRVFYVEPDGDRWRTSYDATLADELYLAVDNASLQQSGTPSLDCAVIRSHA